MADEVTPVSREEWWEAKAHECDAALTKAISANEALEARVAELTEAVVVEAARRSKAVKELDEAVAALREAVSPTGKARSVLSHHILAIMAADDARKSAPAP